MMAQCPWCSAEAALTRRLPCAHSACDLCLGKTELACPQPDCGQVFAGKTREELPTKYHRTTPCSLCKENRLAYQLRWCGACVDLVCVMCQYNDELHEPDHPTQPATGRQALSAVRKALKRLSSDELGPVSTSVAKARRLTEAFGKGLEDAIASASPTQQILSRLEPLCPPTKETDKAEPGEEEEEKEPSLRPAAQLLRILGGPDLPHDDRNAVADTLQDMDEDAARSMAKTMLWRQSPNSASTQTAAVQVADWASQSAAPPPTADGACQAVPEPPSPAPQGPEFWRSWTGAYLLDPAELDHQGSASRILRVESHCGRPGLRVFVFAEHGRGVDASLLGTPTKQLQPTPQRLAMPPPRAPVSQPLDRPFTAQGFGLHAGFATPAKAAAPVDFLPPASVFGTPARQSQPSPFILQLSSSNRRTKDTYAATEEVLPWDGDWRRFRPALVVLSDPNSRKSAVIAYRVPFHMR